MKKFKRKVDKIFFTVGAIAAIVGFLCVVFLKLDIAVGCGILILEIVFFSYIVNFLYAKIEQLQEKVGIAEEDNESSEKTQE